MLLGCLKGEAGRGHGALQCSIPNSGGLHGLGSGCCVYPQGSQTGDLVSKSWSLIQTGQRTPGKDQLLNRWFLCPWVEGWVDAALSPGSRHSHVLCMTLGADEDTLQLLEIPLVPANAAAGKDAKLQLPRLIEG